MNDNQIYKIPGSASQPLPDTAGQSAADQPTADQPAADQPAADQPAADQPAAAELPVAESLPITEAQSAPVAQSAPLSAAAEQQGFQIESKRDDDADAKRQAALQALSGEYDAEALSAAVDALDRVAKAMAGGELNAELVEMARKALNYDADVAAAELRGRNARLDQLEADERRGDGVPFLGGGDCWQRPRIASIFDLARGA